MSTRSCIMIKVKEEDLNKVKSFNAKALPVKAEDWDGYTEKTCEDKAQPVKIEKAYIGIYCHSDGYPSGVGSALKEKFNDYETILNLIIGGDCSSVWFDSVMRYANRDGEEWKYIKPTQGDKPENVYKRFDDAEYCYLFEDGVGWKVKSFYSELAKGFVEYNNETE